MSRERRWPFLQGVIGIASALIRRVRVFVIPNIRNLCGGEFPLVGFRPPGVEVQPWRKSSFIGRPSVYVVVCRLPI